MLAGGSATRADRVGEEGPLLRGGQDRRHRLHEPDHRAGSDPGHLGELLADSKRFGIEGVGEERVAGGFHTVRHLAHLRVVWAWMGPRTRLHLLVDLLHLIGRQVKLLLELTEPLPARSAAGRPMRG